MATLANFSSPLKFDCFSAVDLEWTGFASSFTVLNAITVLQVDGTPYPAKTWQVASCSFGNQANIPTYVENWGGGPPMNGTGTMRLIYVGNTPPNGFGGINAAVRTDAASTGLTKATVVAHDSHSTLAFISGSASTSGLFPATTTVPFTCSDPVGNQLRVQQVADATALAAIRGHEMGERFYVVSTGQWWTVDNTNTLILEGAGGARVPAVTYSTGAPAAVTAALQEGDVHIQTHDGTAAGVALRQWVFDRTAAVWIMSFGMGAVNVAASRNILATDYNQTLLTSVGLTLTVPVITTLVGAVSGYFVCRVRQTTGGAATIAAAAGVTLVAPFGATTGGNTGEDRILEVVRTGATTTAYWT